MNKYEIVTILDSNKTEEQRNKAIAKIREYISNNGTIEQEENLGLKKLAYEVRKNKEAYFYRINFKANADSIADLERICRITDEIIKFIVVKQD